MKIDCEAFRDRLALAKSAVSKDLREVHMDFRGEEAFLAAESVGVTVSCRLPGCSGKGRWSADPAALMALMANRKTMTAKASGGTLKFKAGSYSGELALLEWRDAAPEPPDEGVVIESGSRVGKTLADARAKLALTDPLNPNREPFLCVRIEGGRMQAASFDPVHSGLFEAEAEASDLSFDIHDITMRTVVGLIRAEDEYEITVGEKSVYIDSPDLKASLDMRDIDSGRFGQLVDIAADLRKAASASAILDSSLIKTTAANVMAVDEKGRAVEFEISDGRLTLSCETSRGKIHDSHPCKTKGEGKLAVSPAVLTDLCRVMPSKEAKVGIVARKAGKSRLESLTFAFADVFYIMAAS